MPLADRAALVASILFLGAQAEDAMLFAQSATTPGASTGDVSGGESNTWRKNDVLNDLMEPAWESICSLGVEVVCFGAAFAAIRLAPLLREARGKEAARSHAKKWPQTAAQESAGFSLEARRTYRKIDAAFGQDAQHWAECTGTSPSDTSAKVFVSRQQGAQGRTKPEDLLTSLARSGNEAEVERLLQKEESEAEDGRVSFRSLALVVRGYLRACALRPAAEKLRQMQTLGHEPPNQAITELVQAAVKANVLKDVLEWLGPAVRLPANGIAHFLSGCLQTEDAAAALALDDRARSQGAVLSQADLECLLKLYVKADEDRAVDVFRRMEEAGGRPSEGFCRFIIARCAESKHVQCAEAIADHLRSRSEMTFACYKTLMKVYAFSSLFHKACDLYDEIKLKGLEPDAVMYGSLLKFAVKAGRTELSQEIFEKAEGGCIKNHMWLIRSAGQEGNVERAVATFRKLQQNLPDMVDVIAFNIVLDACCSNGDMAEALRLLDEMKTQHEVNVVTYNTLMKGYCVAGDMTKAKALLKDMEEHGLAPDAASFSCLLSGACKLVNLSEAEQVLARMDRQGIPLDSYIVSIMMQVCRKLPHPSDGKRALQILDRPDVNICEDEVVFNTVLDACIFRRDRTRLERALQLYERSTLTPGVRTYGLLIKASAVLRRTSSCWSLWRDMTQRRGLHPTDVTLGCMIDALVEGNRVDEALGLFQDWKSEVACDTIVYSTLIKGFASVGDADRAMALYRDMKEQGVQMNHIVYTALINAHARTGLVKRAEALLEDMTREGFKPNAITYSSLVRGYCVRSDLTSALQLFHKMLNLGFGADAVVFNTLLDGCVQAANWDLAEEVLGEMKKHGVGRSNYTLSILVKMWSKRGNLDKAFEKVYEALSDPHGACVDQQVGACIVGACIHNRAPERALAVFEEMKTWPNFDGPDANTYSALISGLPRHGLARKAAQLAEEACSALRAAPGQDRKMLAPNALVQLFKALKHERLLNELGRPLAAKLAAAGMHVDERWLG